MSLANHQSLTKPTPEQWVDTPAANRQAFLVSLGEATTNIAAAVRLGQALARKDFQRLFFVGCGAPNHMMYVLEYWLKQTVTNLDIRRYFSAELVHQDPAGLDEHTLVILGSDSGHTPETVQAAQYVKTKSATSIAITQLAQSALGSSTNEVLAYGKTRQGYYASYILCQAFVSAFLSAKDHSPMHKMIVTTLPALPEALWEAMEAGQESVADHIRTLGNDRLLYVVGAGPMYATAYILATCFLMEMQWLHAHPLLAAEFFHGPFEVIDPSIPVIVLVGEDPHRSEAERVVKFCRRYTDRLITYHSSDFKMSNIPSEIRSFVAPFILDAALTRLVEQLAAVNNHPLSTRRYMGKVEY